MLFDPVEAAEKEKLKHLVVTAQGIIEEAEKRQFKGNLKLFERWVRFKQFVLLKAFGKGDGVEPVQEKRKSLLRLLFSCSLVVVSCGIWFLREITTNN